MLSLWRKLLGLASYADCWLADGVYLSERHALRLAREAEITGRDR